MPTFSTSQDALAYLQGKYGSANYRSWQSVRKPLWSFVDYPAAGAAILTFFGDSIGAGGLTAQMTNMQKAGSPGQNHFLLKSIQTSVYIADWMENGAFTVDADVMYSDLIAGWAQAGMLRLTIGQRDYAQIPKPFLFCPPANGQHRIHNRGILALTLTEGTPNVFASSRTVHPSGTLLERHESKYRVDPNILIEAEQNFQVTIEFPSGALAAIASNVVNDSTNPLKVGVILDGIIFRPVQ